MFLRTDQTVMNRMLFVKKKRRQKGLEVFLSYRGQQTFHIDRGCVTASITKHEDGLYWDTAIIVTNPSDQVIRLDYVRITWEGRDLFWGPCDYIGLLQGESLTLEQRTTLA